MRKIFLFLLFLGHSLLGQMQTAHWYFGINAGVDFSSGVPISDNNGQINTNEGSTSISDEYGNLLFYTDGETIYDRTHNIMENGEDLGGHKSSTTSAIILPKPDDCFLYYVFTIDVQPGEGGYRGVEYNIVDMTANGGLGAVIENNVQLPINGQQNSSEKLAGISNADRTGYWVLTHFAGNFYAFEVNADGVNHNPIVSPSTINPQVLPDGSYAVGYLKGSPDGSKLGMGMVHDNYNDIIGSLSVYDFDNSTGIVSNEVILYPPGNADKAGFYAIEFSANSRALYTKTFKNSQISKIFQYDLTASSIIDSEYLVANGPMIPNAMQRALDGHIYLSNPLTHYLSRIENPEIIYNPTTGNAPTYVPNAVYIENLSSIGLPTFLNYYFRISITVDGLSIDEELEYCTGVAMNFDFCHQGGIIDSIHWDFGDGEESTEMYPQHYYNEPGTYTITLTLMVEGEEYVRTFEITIMGPPDIENAEQSVCLNEGDEYTFNLEDSLPDINPDGEDYDITFHLTQEDAENGINPQPTLYTAVVTTIIWVRAEDDEGCFVIRELHLIINSSPEFSFESPVEICEGTSVFLEITTDAENIVFWYDSENASVPIFSGNPFETPILNQEISYWVEVQSPAGCISERAEIKVEITEPVTPLFDLVLEYCLNSPEVMLPAVSDNGISGSWEPEMVDTSTVGVHIYTFTPDEGQCVSAELTTVTIEILPPPELTIDGTFEICISTSAVLEVITDSENTVNWYENETDITPIYTGNPFTTPILTETTSYWAEAVSEAGCVSERIEVIVEVTDSIIPIFELQSQYCQNTEPQELPTTSDNGITGSWFPAAIDTSTAGTQTYIFTPDEGQCATDSEMTVEVIETPELVLPEAPETCSGETATITVSTTGETINWYEDEFSTIPFHTGITYTTPPLTESATYWIEAVNGECISERLALVITVNELPEIEAENPDPVCVGNSVELSVLTNGEIINWYDSEDGTTPIYTGNPFITPLLTETTSYWAEAVSEAGCVSERIEVIVGVTDSIIPIFDLQYQYCLDAEPQELPTTSDNGITGSWFPAAIDTSTAGTQTYTFTPDEGQCAEVYPITIETAESIAPVFSDLPEIYCFNSEAEALPAVSDNGISGSWYPGEINTGIQGVTSYVFTPDGNQCSEPYELVVTVYPYPEMELEDDIVICSGDSYSYLAPEGFDYYIWTDSFGNVLSETREIIFTEEGIYTLTVEINGIPCTLSRNIEVSFSTTPIITEIKSTESTLTVYATGNGPFEYSLDEIFWQSSNVFYNLEPGIYFVYVRDGKGCGSSARQGAIMGVPNFISPNGDGKNDTWKIRALAGFPNTRLQIFDRYGKMFIDRILDGDFEWDGRYNREPLPSGTYWYILILEDGEKLSGHINLRNY